MGAVCARYSWTCRPLWSLFIILATVSCTSRCSESPAAAKGKMYPRGNHWAVGHLMGKKSIERLPDPPEASSGHLMPPDVAGATEPDRYQGLLEALVLQQNHGNTVSRAADWLRGQRSGWREEERDKYLREMSHLLLWALKMQDGDSA